MSESAVLLDEEDPKIAVLLLELLDDIELLLLDEDDCELALLKDALDALDDDELLLELVTLAAVDEDELLD